MIPQAGGDSTNACPANVQSQISIFECLRAASRNPSRGLGFHFDTAGNWPSMIDDPDIVRAAKLMIQQHGDEASRRAVRRANDLEKGGDISECANWRQIVIA